MKPRPGGVWRGVLLRLALLALLVVALSSPAAADHEETERRLKAVGIDDALRKRIHAAIERSVSFLLEHQGPQGSWMPRSASMRRWRVGVTALSALALRHAGTAAARKGVDKALRFLMGPDGKGREGVLGGVYTGGITTMLLMADRSHHDVARTITKRMAACQRRSSGWWGYELGDGAVAQTTVQRDRSNLSTSQFGALGLWAGSRTGVEIAPEVWRRTLEGMICTQLAGGSWNYFPRATSSSAGYPTGTFMGIANLVLAEQALGPVLAADHDLAKRTLAARLRALGALRREGRAFLASFEPGEGAAYVSSYYTLYALEKACLFVGLEKLGDLPWYRSGALSLLDRQNPDGGWSAGGMERSALHEPASDFVSTAFALLFLLRSSEVYRPTTPSPVDQAKPVVTPAK